MRRILSSVLAISFACSELSAVVVGVLPRPPGPTTPCSEVRHIVALNAIDGFFNPRRLDWKLRSDLSERKMLEFVYAIYEQDKLFAADDIASLRVQDQAMNPGTVLYVAKLQDLSGKPSAVVRAVTNVVESGFSPHSPPNEKSIQSSQLPMFQEFQNDPDIRQKIESLGPAIEIGRLAVDDGGSRLGQALMLVVKVLELVPDRTDSDPSPDTMIVAHANNAINAGLYRRLGLEEFARTEVSGQKHYLLKIPAQKLKETLFINLKRELDFSKTSPYDAFQLWKTRYLALRESQRQNPFPLLYGAEIVTIMGLFKEAAELYKKAAQLLGRDLEVRLIQRRFSILNALGSGANPRVDIPGAKLLSRLSDIALEFRNDLQSLSPRSPAAVNTRPISYEAEAALESGDRVWMNEAVRSKPEEIKTENINVILKMRNLMLTSKTNEAASILIVLNGTQAHNSRLVYYPEYFDLKSDLAKLAGRVDLQNRYAETAKFLRSL